MNVPFSAVVFAGWISSLFGDDIDELLRQIDWDSAGPPLVVVAFGVAAGLFYAYRTRVSEGEQSEIERAGLKADYSTTKDLTLEALRALELDELKLDPLDYAAERKALLAGGADALRRLETEEVVELASAGGGKQVIEDKRDLLGDDATDEALKELDKREATADGPQFSSAVNRALTWSLGAVIIVAILALIMQQYVGERGEGGSMTGRGGEGMSSSGGGEGMAAPSAEKAPLQARLEANPQDIEALNGLTEIAIGEQDIGTAMSLNKQAIEIDPADPEARIYLAYMRAYIGRGDAALDDIDQILVEHPGHTKALVWKGLLAGQFGKWDESIAALEAALAGEEAGNEFLEERLEFAKLQRDLGAGAPMGPPEGPKPPVPTSASGGEIIVSGTVNLSASEAGALLGSEILFVSLKDPKGGPPLAALKLAPGPFPMAFEVTSANVISMGGAPRVVPDTVDLSVRIDRDGNPMTREDGAPIANIAGVSKGSTGMAVNLK